MDGYIVVDTSKQWYFTYINQCIVKESSETRRCKVAVTREAVTRDLKWLHVKELGNGKTKTGGEKQNKTVKGKKYPYQASPRHVTSRPTIVTV